MLIDDLFERKTLACLIRSHEFLSVAASNLNSAYFEGPMRQNIAKMALDFYQAFGSGLSDLAFVQEVKGLVTSGKIKAAEATRYAQEMKALKALNISDWQFVLKNVMTFVKNRETRGLIEDAVKHLLPKNDFDGIDKRWSKIAQIGQAFSVEPVDFFDDMQIEARRKRRLDEKNNVIRGVSTGIKRLDDALPSGGWRPKELYAISGGPKRGKTMALLWFAFSGALQGVNVPFFSCEVTREVIEDRLDAMISGTVIRHLPSSIDDVADQVKRMRPKGKVLIYEYPTKKLAVSEVERQVRRLEMERGIRIGMIVTDYAGIMKPGRRYDDALKEEASIMEDLRALANKFYVPVLTGNQINRSGANKALVRGTDTAGTFEKIMIVDGNITLGGTDEEIKQGIIRMHLSDMRNAPSRTFKIKTEYNMGKFYKEFIEEEAAT